MSFDTLAYTQKLRSAGITSEHAEVHAQALRDALREEVATKHDIADLRHELQATAAELRTDIAALNHKIDVTDGRLCRQIAEAKTDIIKWLVGIGLALFIPLVTIAVRVWTM
jgi:light-regulated signal transduction histidine kinase (bacteriophytochrome)